MKKAVLFQKLVVVSLLRVLTPHICQVKHWVVHKGCPLGQELGTQAEGSLLELTEDVCILGEDPTGLQHSYSESEGTAQFQVVADLFRETFHDHLTVQQSA